MNSCKRLDLKEKENLINEASKPGFGLWLQFMECALWIYTVDQFK